MALDTTDYAYYKEITISNPSGAYQMRLWVHSGSGTDETGEEGHVFCNSNCNKWPEDIRFGTTQDPETATQLDTWYESGSTSSAPSSLIWVETQDVAGGASTLYMFIGDASADINNNGENTFLFFDDFNDESFDTNKWIEWYSAGGGDYHETGGYLMIDPGSSWQEVGSKYQYAAPKIFRMRAKTTTEAQAWGVGVDERSDGGGYQGAGADWITFGFQTSPQKFYRTKSETDEEYSARSTTLTSYTTLMIKAKSASVAFYENDVLRDTHTDNPPTDPMGFNFEGYGTGHDTYIDWCFVAKCTDSTEPSWASTGDWTSTLTPTLIVINASGALNIDNIYPSATLTGKITGLSGNCWIYWGISDGGNVIADWETSSNLGLQYYDKTGGYFTSSVSLLKNTGFRLSSATRYYYRVYGSSNGWGYGEDWAPSSAEWTTKSQWKIYFVSGETSISPITPATDGYIASTNVRENHSGSVVWNGLNKGLDYKWHAYLYNSVMDEWSPKSDTYSMTINYDRKFLMPYRDGANNVGNDLCYIILSGNTKDATNKTVEIDLVNGEGNAHTCPVYPETFHDKFGRIFVAWTWKNEDGSNDVWGSDTCLYSYPASLQSWKGKYDYWFYVNGTCAGSGTATDGGIGKGGHTGINYATLSSNKAMPVRTLLGCTGPHNDNYHIYNVLPNGEIADWVPVDNNGHGNQGFWYYSSNGNWIQNSPYSVDTNAGSYSSKMASLSSNICVFQVSTTTATNLYTLYMYVSQDNGRNWSDKIAVSSSDISNMQWFYFHPAIARINESYPDNYARVIVIKATMWDHPLSGETYIYKINTESPYDVSHVMTYPSGIGYPVVMMQCHHGTYYNGITMFVFPIATGNVYRPYDGVCPGDSRHLHYWNENTGESGQIQFDSSTQEYINMSHNAAGVRVDTYGRIWCAASAYYGTPEGGSAYRGFKANPDLCSGNNNPSAKNDFGEFEQDLATTDGGCGASFEVWV